MHRFAIAAALIALLLQSGQAIAQSEEKTSLTFVELCASDDATPEAIQEFLDLRVDVNTKDKDENTPLLLCVKRGDIASAKLLIENGGDVDARNKDGLAALYYARRPNQKELEGVLVRAGAKEHPAWIFVDGRTIFEAARDPKTNPNQFSRYIDAIRKAGADIDAKDAGGRTPLYWTAYTSENPEVFTLLIKAGADVNAKGEEGWTPLHWAGMSSSNPEVLTTLIKAGADVNAKNVNSWTPLHNAAVQENPEILTLLIQAGADVNAKDGDGRTPLYYAARHSNFEVITVLIRAGADVNAKDEYYGRTPLHWAAVHKNPEVLTLLIKSGADVNGKGEYRRTPLHWAASRNKNPEVLTILIKAGADVNAKDENGSTPLDRAISGWNNKPIPNNAEVLRAAGGKRGEDLP